MILSLMIPDPIKRDNLAKSVFNIYQTFLAIDSIITNTLHIFFLNMVMFLPGKLPKILAKIFLKISFFFGDRRFDFHKRELNVLNFLNNFFNIPSNLR
jgi:hypothetical protein